MRTRLVIVFLVPLTVIILALGGAYAWSVSRSIQHEFVNEQLGDLAYFVTSARQALRADNPGIIEGEMQRYSELYDAEIAVLDRSGAFWAEGAGYQPAVLDEQAMAQVSLALSGRRSEPIQAGVLPWSFGDTVVVEPVFDDGKVIGVVMISASVDAPRSQIIMHWTALVAVSVVLVALLLAVVFWLANWVLRPMQRVDTAMAAIEHGEMDARVLDTTGPPEMRRMIRLFNQMAEEIERVMSRQREFAANASHELRNPLGALLMRVEYLATGLDSSWDDDVEKTRAEGKRMSRILDTLLSMAKVAQRDSPFAVVDLGELVQQRVTAWRGVSIDREVRLRIVRADAALSTTDRTSVESAFDAVIDNALKFAPRGTAVEVSVEGPRTEVGDAVVAGAAECVISVRDHGPGLGADELERVTSRFWRSPRDENVQGSGLGLAIATDLLDGLSGRLNIVAPDDGGLLVELRLPKGER